MPLAHGDSVIVYGSGDGLLDGRMCLVSAANKDHPYALVSLDGEEDKRLPTKFLHNFAQFTKADASKIATIPPEYRIGRSVVCRSDLPFDLAEITSVYEDAPSGNLWLRLEVEEEEDDYYLPLQVLVDKPPATLNGKRERDPPAERRVMPKTLEMDSPPPRAPAPAELVTEAEGLRLHMSPDNPTGYKGIRVKQGGRFEARTKTQGKDVYLGSFGTAVEAAVAYAKHVGPPAARRRRRRRRPTSSRTFATATASWSRRRASYCTWRPTSRRGTRASR